MEMDWDLSKEIESKNNNIWNNIEYTSHSLPFIWVLSNL